MLLECPNCETVFRINPDDLPAAGRKVQCSVCRTVWQAGGGGNLTSPAAEPAGEDGAGRTIPKDQESGPGQILGRLMIGVVVLLMLGALSGILRQQISAGFPATRPLFEMAGLTITPDTSSLLIRELAGERQRDTIRLTGEVFNRSHLPVHAPVFLLTVTSGIGAVLVQKEFTLDASNIKGKKAASFTVQIQLDQDIPDTETTNITVVPLPKLPR
ncbi:zinc-ribbon domain-containing protein [Alphaproteobacteria bacterium LSUCC0684]